MTQQIDATTYKELLEERISIMMFDAGLPEKDARKAAVNDMILNYHVGKESEERRILRNILKAKM